MSFNKLDLGRWKLLKYSRKEIGGQGIGSRGSSINEGRRVRTTARALLHNRSFIRTFKSVFSLSSQIWPADTKLVGGAVGLGLRSNLSKFLLLAPFRLLLIVSNFFRESAHHSSMTS